MKYKLPILVKIGFLVFAVIIIGLAGLYYQTQKKAIQHEAEENLLSIARLKIDQIAAWRKDRLQEGAEILIRPRLVADLIEWLTGNTQKINHASLLSELDAFRLQHEIKDILLVEADGTIRLSIDGYLEDPEQFVLGLDIAFRDRMPVLTELHTDKANPEPHISVITPLFIDKEQSSPAGAVILVTDASRFLYPLIQSWPVKSDSAETLLVRRDGDDVLFLNNVRHRPDTALKFRIPLSQADLPAAMAIKGERGVAEGNDYRGAEVVSILLPVPDSSWFMIAKVDVEEIFAPWRSRATLIIGLLLCILAMLGAFALFARQYEQKKHFLTLYQTESALRAITERHSITLKAIGDGVIVTDAKGRVELLNSVAEALTGWSNKEACGKPLEDVFTIINEETRALVENPVAKVVREGVVVGLANHTLLLDKHGLERPIADSGAPIRNAQREITGVVLVFRDQSEERAYLGTISESEQRLKRSQEIAHLGSWELDWPKNKLIWSDEVYRIFGLEPQEFEATYEAFLERVHPDDRASVNAAYRNSLREKDSYEIDHRIVRKSTCEIRFVHERCEHFRDADRRVIRSIGMVHDITERKQAEANQALLTDILQVLNRREDLNTLISETLQLIFETGFDAVGLRLRKDEDWPYFVYKGFSEEFLQKENSLCRRKADGEVVRDINGQVVLECTCGLVLSGMTDPSMPFFTKGGGFWTNASSELLSLPQEADPRTNPRNRCIHAGYESVGLFPLRSGHQTIGLLQLNARRGGRFTPELISFYENLAQNIGLALQRAAAEEALRENEARLSAILEQLPIGVGVLNRKGQFLVSNSTLRALIPQKFMPSQDPEQIKLWKSVDAEGRTLPPDQWPDARALRGETVIPGIEFLFGENEGGTWMLVSAVPFRSTDGETIGAITVVQNINDLKRAQQELLGLTATLEWKVAERTELAQARARQLQALAVELIEAEEGERQRISHLLHEDLQQILAAARFQLQAVCKDLPQQTELTEVEQLISESILKSRRLSHELSPAILQHSGLLKSLRWLSQQMGEQFGINVQLECEKDIELEMAPLKIFIFRALQELLFNVVKHADAKSVFVALTSTDDLLTVTVSDKGRGFDPSILENISASTGLGLLSLRERANYIGGSMIIESAPGKGSRLTMSVPLKKFKIGDAPVKQEKRKTSTQIIEFNINAENEIRVLLADDHKVMRQGLIRLLADQPGIKIVGEASNGRLALELSRQLRPHVVVMDIAMPEMDGIEATRLIKAELPDVRVVGLSMYEDNQASRSMCDAGAESFLIKTASSTELLRAIYGVASQV